MFISRTKCFKGGRICNAPSREGTVRVTVGSHMCTKGFLNYLSTIVVFFNIVFKDEIVKFSKNCGTVKPEKKIIRIFQNLQKDNNNNKLQ